MRAYIRALDHVREKGTINYTFASSIEAARFWPTVGVAEGLRNQIVLAGEIVTAKGSCSDFRVEP